MKGHNLLYLLLLLQQIPSYSLSTTPAAISNRIFVAGLDPAVQAHHLEDSLEKYGPITEVVVMDHSDSPFAFVTFEKIESAKHALLRQHSTEMYQELQPAKPRIVHPKAAARILKTDQDWQNKLAVARESNIILQIQKSHMDRWQELIIRSNSCQITVGGSIPETGSRTVALLGLKVEKVDDFLEWLQDLPFDPVGLNKVYVVDPSAVVVLSEEEKKSSLLTQTCLEAMKRLLPSPDSVIRLNVFPPKLTSNILEQLEQQQVNMNVAPTGYTHFLNAVHLCDDQSKRGVWMLGVSDCSWSRIQPQQQSADTYEERANVCRAYYKLREAMVRYDGDVFSQKRSGKLVALDCGAAPGGWTKYLLCEYPTVNCVYSIDPGALDPNVAALGSVKHVQLRVQDALPLLRQQEVRIDVWVSDMCLHQVSEQLDWLLTARDMGLVGPGTFFVLTFKCKMGHSKASFDAQVSKQCRRLDGISNCLQTIHLFANRSGERTVMGYLV